MVEARGTGHPEVPVNTPYVVVDPSINNSSKQDPCKSCCAHCSDRYMTPAQRDSDSGEHSPPTPYNQDAGGFNLPLASKTLEFSALLG